MNTEDTTQPKDVSQMTPAEAKAELAKREQTKMNRRQTLARFGFKAAATAIAALTADDLLRAVGRDMERRAGNDRVARKVAEQFKNAGVSFAVRRSPCSNCTVTTSGGATVYCGDGYCANRISCKNNYLCKGDISGFYRCLDQAKSKYSNCVGGGSASGCPGNPVDCDCNQNETC